MDLVGLHLHSTFMLGRAIKQALISYVRNEDFKINLPKEEKIDLKKIRRRYQLQIFLDDEKDKDIIEWLKGTTNGQRNSLIKNIFRYYALTLYLNGYRDDSKNIYENKKENMRNSLRYDVEVKDFIKKKGKKQELK